MMPEDTKRVYTHQNVEPLKSRSGLCCQKPRKDPAVHVSLSRFQIAKQRVTKALGRSLLRVNPGI